MLETQVSSLSSTMQKSQRYQEYMKVKEVMSPFFKKWQSVNSGVGI